jgi:hypothetical protein
MMKEPDVNVVIIGSGHVGASLAFSFIFHPALDHVYMSDIDVGRLHAELNDLTAASFQLFREEMFSVWNGEPADYYFVCAGYARKEGESDEALFERNIAVVDSIVSRLPKEKVFIITNPSKMLGEFFKCRYLGDALDATRAENGLMSGLEVLTLKGYTNWGIVAEAWMAIEECRKKWY